MTNELLDKSATCARVLKINNVSFNLMAQAGRLRQRSKD
jgi:hypothetical protein